ncbi:MAG: hypothetical protein CFE39_04300 [Comamonadaceae bacterium PBBC2]|nr:MAG: hypothetical protein CFE39_04300 [Comamonadaceae bacterium PBBC2]
MFINKLAGFFAFFGVCLLAGCGGGGSDTPSASTRDGYVYMAGGFVEGLSYSTETQSGTTGPRGQFKYQTGETVVFKVGNQALAAYKIKLNAPLPLTHFEILGTRNPNATAIQNLSVLLHMLDEDGVISNGIKLSATKLTVANRVNAALQAETYLSALAAEAAKAQIAVPDLGSVLSRSTAQMKADGVSIAPYAFGSASFNEFNSIITLSAVGSADANSDPLTYNWTIDSRPKSSNAVIANPTSSAPTLVVDAFDEPYIFRLTVTDSGGLNTVTQVTVSVSRNPIAGVYTQTLDANTRQVVAITDTSEIWGYALSNSANRSRRFMGPMARTSDSLPQYAVSSLNYQTTQLCNPPCADRIDLTANFSSPRSIAITNDWANSFLFESLAPAQLTAATLSDRPMLIANLAGTYREKDSAPDSKDWKITAKGEFNFYKSLNNKSTLCAIGQIAIDKDGQVLNRQGFVTRYTVPVSIEFKDECDENFDVGTTSTGYFLPDPTLGNAGFSFLGKNASGSRMFLRHFIKQ